MKKQQQTIKLLARILKEMGCPYEIECNHAMMFIYKIHLFFAVVEEDFIIVVDKDWDAIDLEDLDEVLRMRKAINTVNRVDAVSTFYAINEKEKKMYVSGKYRFYFDSCIADKAFYLRDVMDEFFEAHQCLTLEMEKLRDEDEA